MAKLIYLYSVSHTGTITIAKLIASCHHVFFMECGGVYEDIRTLITPFMTNGRKMPSKYLSFLCPSKYCLIKRHAFTRDQIYQTARSCNINSAIVFIPVRNPLLTIRSHFYRGHGDFICSHLESFIDQWESLISLTEITDVNVIPVDYLQGQSKMFRRNYLSSLIKNTGLYISDKTVDMIDTWKKYNSRAHTDELQLYKARFIEDRLKQNRKLMDFFTKYYTIDEMSIDWIIAHG